MPPDAGSVEGAEMANGGSGVARLPVMADVAARAGVSHQTVSRVLNDHPNVRPETRERVLEAIKYLGYRRNAAARMLVTRRSGALGVVSLDSTLYGPASTVYGIEQAARQEGFYISIASLPAIDRRTVLEAIERLRDQAVEGVIVIAPHNSAIGALAHLPAGVAVVGVGSVAAPNTSTVAVSVDNLAGAAQATKYLLDLGHPTVHHLAGPANWLDAQKRLDGWRLTLEAAGADVPPPLMGDWSARSGYEIGQRVARDPAVTAVLCANDNVALGLLRALQENGRRVPQDISVIGFDDVPEAAYYLPPLTTMRQDFGELGRRALRAVLDLLDAPGSETAQAVPLVPPELVVRRSAAPPSTSRTR